VPAGYYKDAAKSAATFVTVEGVRYSIPGDRAVMHADGTLQLVGRDSLCINSGGEKVFPEEVEAVLLDHERVTDALVVGMPDAQWGQVVTAVVSADRKQHPAVPAVEELTLHVRNRLAGFKAPRYIVFVDTVPRGPNGKPDYAMARRIVEEDRNRSAGSVTS
jgi:fatty-acyl-CoA synthase